MNSASSRASSDGRSHYSRSHDGIVEPTAAPKMLHSSFSVPQPPELAPEAIAQVLAFQSRLAAATPAELSNILQAFIQTLYQTQFIFRFDWPQWIFEAQAITQQPERIAELDLLTLRQLMTVYVRTHQFDDGYLPQCREGGQLNSILLRLAQLASP